MCSATAQGHRMCVGGYNQGRVGSSQTVAGCNMQDGEGASVKVVPLRCVHCRSLLAVRQNKEHKQAELQSPVHSRQELEDDFDVTEHATYGIRR